MTAIVHDPPMTRPAPRRGAPRGLAALVRSELVLFSRDPGSVFFALLFPTVLAVGLGFALPGMRDPIESPGSVYDGALVIAMFMPVIMATAIAAPALTTLPSYVAGYRERGVLRRLAATPMRPHGILIAQVVVNVIAFVAAAALALGLSAIVFDLEPVRQPLLLVAAFLLGAAATFGIGLLIAALAAKASTANGLGMLAYFPLLFFAGLWTPGPIMPDIVESIARFTPLGAASQAMTEAWFGTDVPWLQLGVMVAYVAVLYPLASRLFRWS
ncbi:ABC transporter permease [Georgenia sp. Z1491]|uniref:ABC transporter permease n=1 Tax=Georgenia sp. Z1491 TaxID=3416707 RepID=UPI003CE80A36